MSRVIISLSGEHLNHGGQATRSRITLELINGLYRLKFRVKVTHGANGQVFQHVKGSRSLHPRNRDERIRSENLTFQINYLPTVTGRLYATFIRGRRQGIVCFNLSNRLVLVVQIGPFHCNQPHHLSHGTRQDVHVLPLG